ncbi:DUF4962 domain-containing protein [Bacteroides sedimenti]|uniref:DUF4962 domain-containing protein n=1 Tax=Bacteroides sedimenti TaxID=2136147 RepID=UPI00333E3A65
MLNKRYLFLLFSLSILPLTQAGAQTAEKSITKQAIHPRYREWASPSNGKEVSVNPVPFLWPSAGKGTIYKVRFSKDKNFPAKATFTSENISWAMYDNHKKLQPGNWFWQYGVVKEKNVEWSAVFNFKVTGASRAFETPTVKEFLSKCSGSHPRLYVTAGELADFRKRNQNTQDANQVIKRADKQLKAALPKEEPTRPRDTTNLSASEKNVMMTFMYHGFGNKVADPISDLSMAYLLTGDKAYGEKALKQALHLAKMDPKGNATNDDFNSAAVMEGMAAAFDAAYDLMKPAEKQQLLDAIKVRGTKFFRQYANEFETHSMDNHVWQHTLRQFCNTSIAVMKDLPEASQWLAYCYEVWCSRFPILGADDGGWHDGTSYFAVNFETFIYMPFTFSRLTGVDFFNIPYFHNLPKFVIYSYPKNSYSTGFGDNAENKTSPDKAYMGFMDALARELKNPYARWYADKLAEDESEGLSRAKEFTFYRLMTKNPQNVVKAQVPDNLPQGLLFRDAGFALMHNNVADAKKDVMINFTALPFGATGHAHAAHNGFGINVGGKQLYGGSGYYSNFTDAHTLMHYRTRGHNTILADSMAQCIGENGYGWIARFKNTPALTYVLGDATHAYDLMTTDFWIDRMKQFNVEYTKKNGFGNPGVTRFRRHFVFLRPDIVVIYDELRAKKPITWTWLLHSYNQMEKGEKENVIFGGNEVANSRVDLFCPYALNNNLTNEFFSPAINWKQRGGMDASEAYDYKKHWHSELTTQSKTPAMRFLAVIQIDRDKKTTRLMAPKEISKGKWEIGGWNIEAEMDGAKAPFLIVRDNKGNAVEYNLPGNGKIKGSTVIKERNKIAEELIDIIPDAAK